MQAQLKNENNSRSLIINNDHIISKSIGNAVASQINFPLPKITRPILRKVAGLKKLDPLYNLVNDSANKKKSLAQNILNAMNITLNVNGNSLANIPKEGPLVIVANHPYGGLDGIALLALLRKVRPDVKLMANYLLGEIPNLNEHLVTVDPFGAKNSLKNNRQGLKDAKEWLNDGHVLGIFPAGEVSSYSHKKRSVIDKEWAKNIGTLIRKNNCNVIAVNFDGHNRLMFQLMGLVHPSLRTLMLPREFMHVSNHELKVNISSVVKSSKIGKFSSDSDIMQYLRMRCEILSDNTSHYKYRQKMKNIFKSLKKRYEHDQVIEDICQPISSELLTAEFNDLPVGKILKTSGNYQVYCVDASDIPLGLKELGLLRETTFRAVGEGTNKACDLDYRDNYYKHLILWNSAEKEIMGAYRMGLVDKLTEEFGFSGVYTSTLFNFSKRMEQELANGIELGRSFIQAKYQRNPIALGLLWKGVMAFVAQNPQYTKLFGPVSISNDYQDLSKYMIMDFLKNNHFNNNLAGEVTAKHLPKIKVKNYNDDGAKLLNNMSDIDELIADIETKCPHAPVLIRQYIRLNGKFLAFNVDPDFNNSLDALILTDLTEKSVVTSRYMGKEKYEKFLAFNARN